MENEKLKSKPCKLCGKPIIFVSMSSGRLMPCDADSETTTISVATGETLRGFIPHWATCPDADKFRKKRSKNGSP